MSSSSCWRAACERTAWRVPSVVNLFLLVGQTFGDSYWASVPPPLLQEILLTWANTARILRDEVHSCRIFWSGDAKIGEKRKTFYCA